MNSVTGGVFTAAIGVGILIAWFAGGFGTIIGQIVDAVTGQASPTSAPASSAGPVQLQAA